jgi:hypothetical protein
MQTAGCMYRTLRTEVQKEHEAVLSGLNRVATSRGGQQILYICICINEL